MPVLPSNEVDSGCQQWQGQRGPPLHQSQPYAALTVYEVSVRSKHGSEPHRLHSLSRAAWVPSPQGLLSLYLRVLLLFLSIHTARAGQQPEARVATPAAVVAGGDGASISTPLSALSSKPGGFPITTRPSLNVTQTRSAKRAYQRACNRAIRFGQTRYRGRTLLASQVPQANRHTALTSITKTTTHAPRPDKAAKGIQILTWNAGGLGGGLYDELLTFLTSSTIDVAVIQESKWAECMEYTTGQWTCVHSGCRAHKQGGLLVLVHSRIAMPCQLRFEHLLQGRLLQVRIPLKGTDSRHLHVFAVYQKTHDVSNKQAPQQRQQVWQALHKASDDFRPGIRRLFSVISIQLSVP